MAAATRRQDQPILAELLTDSEDGCRAHAAEGLASYAPEAKPFVPALVAALNDPVWRVRIEVARALVAADPEHRSEASAALFPLLLNPEATQEVFFVLGQMGADGVAYLRQELRGPSVAGRVGAARSLGLLAERAQDAFEDLVAVLDDGPAEVRYVTAQALVRIAASRAGAAIPHLVTGLESADAALRGEAAHLLGLLARAGQQADVALPALSKLLTDPEVCLEAALTLVEIDAGQAAAAVPVLVEALERRKPREGPHYEPPDRQLETILAALGRIGPPAAVAVPLLRQTMQAPHTGIWVKAASALVRVAPEGTTEVVNRLLPLTSAVDDHYFWEGIAVLGEIGPAARGAAPRLEEWLFDEAGWGSSEYSCPEEPVPLMFATLVKIDPTAPMRVLARVEADLQSPERFDQAVKLLLAIAAGIPRSAPLLASLLQDSRAEGQWDALLSALGDSNHRAQERPDRRGRLMVRPAPTTASTSQVVLGDRSRKREDGLYD